MCAGVHGGLISRVKNEGGFDSRPRDFFDPAWLKGKALHC
jgi:hypothetical protein